MHATAEVLHQMAERTPDATMADVSYKKNIINIKIWNNQQILNILETIHHLLITGWNRRRLERGMAFQPVAKSNNIIYLWPGLRKKILPDFFFVKNFFSPKQFFL